MNRGGQIKHGHALRHNASKLYGVWWNMIQRINNLNNIQYKDYGGRGITICNEWYKAANFISWAETHGYKEGLMFDRQNNDGNYCPDNCRFVTRSISQINKRKRENYGIQPYKKRFRVYIGRDHHIYWGGSASTIEEAQILRDILVAKLDNN